MGTEAWAGMPEPSVILDVINLISDGVALFELSPNNDPPQFLFVNAAISERIGYSREDLIRDPSPFFAEQKNVALAERLRVCATSGDQSPFDIPITRNDNTIYWIRLICKQARQPDGDRIFLLGITENISDDIDSEHHRELLAACIEQSSDAIVIFQVEHDNPMDRTVAYANQAFFELSGYSREDVASDPHISLDGPLTDLTLAAENMEKLQRGESFHGIQSFHRKNASSFIAEVHGRPMHVAETQANYYWISTFHDITKMLSDNAQIRLLAKAIDQANDFVIITDGTPPSHGGPYIAYVNAAFLGTTGWNIDEVLGRPMSFVVSTETPEQTQRTIIDNTEHEREINNEVLLRRKGATPVWADFVGQPLRDEHGAVSHWLAVGRDIRPRKEAQTQLSLLVSALDIADATVTLYTLDHEGALEIVYENALAIELAAHSLPMLFANESIRGMLMRGERVHRWIPILSGTNLIDVCAFGLRDADGKVTSFASIGRPMLASKYADNIPSESVRLDALSNAMNALADARGETERLDILKTTLLTFFDARVDIRSRSGSEPDSLNETSREANFAFDSGHQSLHIAWGSPLKGLDFKLIEVFIEAFLIASIAAES